MELAGDRDTARTWNSTSRCRGASRAPRYHRRPEPRDGVEAPDESRDDPVSGTTRHLGTRERDEESRGPLQQACRDASSWRSVSFDLLRGSTVQLARATNTCSQQLRQLHQLHVLWSTASMQLKLKSSNAVTSERIAALEMENQIRLLFQSIDQRDTDAFLAFLSDDVVFRFGNAAPVKSKAEVDQVVQGFLTV